MRKLTSIEICAGAGGQALGLEIAGFEHKALVEIDPNACNTLRANRPQWPVIESDLKTFHANDFTNVDLFAGGVPCPPFSIAGKQLGSSDERDLFPEALRLIQQCNPKAVMIENVKGILSAKFADYRQDILSRLSAMGYICEWRLIQSSDHGVSQLRPRAILIGLQKAIAPFFQWPENDPPPVSVGELLIHEMRSLGWEKAEEWLRMAGNISPTLVGGSKKHGGADLGPTRAKKAWALLGIDGKGLANHPPLPGFTGAPRLTVSMAALVQGFPPEWVFTGKKTAAYRQVGNAFPPPVAYKLGLSVRKAILDYESFIIKQRRQSQIA